MKAKFFYVFMAALLAAGACKKSDEAKNENEHEAINKVELAFSQGGVPQFTYVVEDPDGDGGNPPSRIDTIKLTAGQTYTMDIKIKNLSASGEKDITGTIVQQATSHEMYYLPSGITVNITKNDKDSKNYPLGLNSTWVAGTAGQGSVLVKLMHKPVIKGPTDAPTVGHSDLAVTIPVKLQ